MEPPTPPELPTETLFDGGWVQVEASVETLFEMPVMAVTGATVRFEDGRTRRILREATGGRIDRQMRFFAGTTLGFDPPPPLGVSPTMFAPTLRSEVRRQFARRLRERGLEDVQRQRTERLRVDGNRAKLTQFRAADTIDDRRLPLECWVAVWTDRSDVKLVTGGYPDRPLADVFDIDGQHEALTRSGTEYREEFLSLLRAVE